MASNNSFSISPESLTRDHVRDLPLHEVTKTFGTLGLFLRLEDTLEASGLADVPEIAWATQFGLTLHSNDRRTNGHYADHILRVPLRIIERYKITDPDIIIGAILHDGPEDHADAIVKILSREDVDSQQEARGRAFDLLEAEVGSGATNILRCVTNPIVAPGEDKLTVYSDHTRNMVENEPKARVVKVSDFTDNGVGNHYTVGDKQLALDRKYVDLYQIHRAGLFMPDSLITGQERLYVLRQLTEGHARALARMALAEE
jgi:hypothetical protein